MGRSTYDFIAPFAEWPYQGKPVHVLSTTLEPGADARITVHRSLDAAVEALSAAGYRRVYVDGGKTVHAFLRAGLVDELLLYQAPLLLGELRKRFRAVRWRITPWNVPPAFLFACSQDDAGGGSPA